MFGNKLEEMIERKRDKIVARLTARKPIERWICEFEFKIGIISLSSLSASSCANNEILGRDWDPQM